MTVSKLSDKDRVLLKIRQASDLPAMAETVTILNKFKSSEDSSVSDLANILLKDYALTTKVLKIVNSVHYMQSGQVTTISRAIFLMGVDHIKNMAMTLMLFDHLQKNNARSEVMDAMLQAFCGGVLARKIVADLNDVEEEEAFICALLHPLGKIIVAYTMPDKTAAIRAMSMEQNISEEQASASVLGVSYQEIGTTLAAEWNYPQKIVQSMQHVRGEDAPALPSDSQKLSMVASLSTEMSNVLGVDADHAEKTVRLKSLISSYEGGLPLAGRSKEVDKVVTASIQDFQKLAENLHLDLKRSVFGKRLDDMTTSPERRATDTEVFSFKTDALKSIDTLVAGEEESAETIFSKGIQDINNSLLGPCALNDVIRIALETIYRGLRSAEIRRVLFLVRDVKQPLMQIRLGFGTQVNEAKSWFIIPLGDSKDIFNAAVEKDSDLIIRDMESGDIRKYIPSWYRDHTLQGGYILLLPVTINKKNIGLICVEGEQRGYPNIRRADLNYLRILRDQAVLATRQSLMPEGKQYK